LVWLRSEVRVQSHGSTRLRVAGHGVKAGIKKVQKAEMRKTGRSLFSLEEEEIFLGAVPEKDKIV